MIRTPKRPRDTNQLAKYIVDLATTELPAVPESEMAQRGRLGGLAGGNARAEALDPETRSQIAKRAADARWKKSANKP